MPVLISMLRAVNVGGRNIVKMEELQALYLALGFLNPRTFIQSGNVIFEAKERNLAGISAKLEDAIEQNFGCRAAVILRTVAELRQVMANNPFAEDRGMNPATLLVTFLATEPNAESKEKLTALKTESERLRVVGREIYVHYPNGSGRSKLTGAVMEKIVKTPGTARNWNTVGKLLQMAEERERSL